MTTANLIIKFNSELNFDKPLPPNVSIMNPFREGTAATQASQNFYKKYMNDTKKRRMILGMNPGRHGAGHTGIPLTDTHRLHDYCGITFDGSDSYEISSVFFYNMITAYGGVEKFYSDFYVNSVCPLGFLYRNSKGNNVNYSYYETPELEKLMTPFILSTLKQQLTFNIDPSVCFLLGKGENYDFLKKLNMEHGFFDKIVPLDHPRYVQEYHSKEAELYIDKYINAFTD